MVARLCPGPGDLIEIFEPMFEMAVLSRRMNALIIKMQSMIITIYASGIVTMTRQESADQAEEQLNYVVDRINQCIKQPGLESDLKSRSLFKNEVSGKRPDPMELTALLPRINCTECGAKSCFYFSILLACSLADIEKCPHLKEERYSVNKRELERLMNEVR